MSRPYSQDFRFFLKRIDDLNNHTLGTTLAKACVDANIPAVYVAQILGASRMSVHSWFRGKSKAQEKFVPKITSLLELIKTDTEAGILPLRSAKDAKTYVSGLTPNGNMGGNA